MYYQLLYRNNNKENVAIWLWSTGALDLVMLKKTMGLISVSLLAEEYGNMPYAANHGMSECGKCSKMVLHFLLALAKVINIH